MPEKDGQFHARDPFAPPDAPKEFAPKHALRTPAEPPLPPQVSAGSASPVNPVSEALPFNGVSPLTEQYLEGIDLGSSEPLPPVPMPKAPFSRRSGKPATSSLASLMEVVEIFVGALVAAILILTLVCRTGVVKGTSMTPTMDEGDRYLISDLFYSPKQGDIVVFRPEVPGEDELWIKRVIAVEGQTVYIDPNTYEVYVDGQVLNESAYLSGNVTDTASGENPVTVPEGCVYVLGDNRAVSHDSRYADLGCVQVGQLIGHVVLRFWPISSFGLCR